MQTVNSIFEVLFLNETAFCQLHYRKIARDVTFFDVSIFSKSL